MKDYLPIKFSNHSLFLLDQRKLPTEEITIECKTIENVHAAIKDMVVRGAPSIGFTAIFGMALWLKKHPDFSLDQYRKACEYLKSARPTAVNLAFEINRTIDIVSENLRDSSVTTYEAIINFGTQPISFLLASISACSALFSSIAFS